MLKKIRKRRTSINNLIVKTLRELNKQRSKLKIASNRLRKREHQLFNACISSLEKRQKDRAVIYANEAAEVRKILSLINSTEMMIERIILRLETLMEFCSAVREIEGTFSEVKGVLGSLAEVMPSVSPEIERLSSIVNDILYATSIGDTSIIEPVIIKNELTENILREASKIVEEELLKKIPEPPTETERMKPLARKQLIALTAGGSEIYSEEEDEKPQKLLKDNIYLDKSPSLLEELVLDYIYRNNGEIELARCSEELNLSQNEILNILDALRMKGKIRIEQ